MQSLQNVLVLQERENKSGGRERKERAESWELPASASLQVGRCAALGRSGGAPWEKDKTSSGSLGTAFLLQVVRLQELVLAAAASQPTPSSPCAGGGAEGAARAGVTLRMGHAAGSGVPW